MTAYFVLVPWELTLTSFYRSQHDVPVAMFLRFTCVLLAWFAWDKARRSAGREQATSAWRRAAPAAGLTLGLLTALCVALIEVLFPLVYGHRPRDEVEAEQRAAAQLGPEYANYRYFVRELHPVFRRGDSVTHRASVIAYNFQLTDVLDVAVTWKEPWTGPR